MHSALANRHLVGYKPNAVRTSDFSREGRNLDVSNKIFLKIIF